MQAKIKIAETPKPISTNRLIQLLFGMSLNELARDIRLNPGGIYDNLYSSPAKKGGAR